jgi:hypothetical protein
MKAFSCVIRGCVELCGYGDREPAATAVMAGVSASGQRGARRAALAANHDVPGNCFTDGGCVTCYGSLRASAPMDGCHSQSMILRGVYSGLSVATTRRPKPSPVIRQSTASRKPPPVCSRMRSAEGAQQVMRVSWGLAHDKKSWWFLHQERGLSILRPVDPDRDHSSSTCKPREHGVARRVSELIHDQSGERRFSRDGLQGRGRTCVNVV